LPVGLRIHDFGLRIFRAFIYATVIGSSLYTVQYSIIPRLRLFAINIQLLLKFTIYASAITISYGLLSVAEFAFFSNNILNHLFSANIFSLIAHFFSSPISGQDTQQLIPDWAVAVFFFMATLTIMIIIVSLVFSLIDTKWHQYASEKQLSEARLRLLETQLKPHFLFNTLNTIVSVVRIDPPKAETLLLELSDFLRYNFDFANRQTTAIEDEIHFTELYLALLQSRFENLEWKCRLGPEARGMTVPVLILQPLVENAVKHGWQDPEKKLHITIDVLQKNRSLIIEIIDNGRGMDAIALRGIPIPGHAMHNINERLRLYYGPDRQLSIHSAVGKGTKVTIRLPGELK